MFGRKEEAASGEIVTDHTNTLPERESPSESLSLAPITQNETSNDIPEEATMPENEIQESVPVVTQNLPETSTPVVDITPSGAAFHGHDPSKDLAIRVNNRTREIAISTPFRERHLSVIGTDEEYIITLPVK